MARDFIGCDKCVIEARERDGWSQGERRTEGEMALEEGEKEKDDPEQSVQCGRLNIVLMQPERRKDGGEIKTFRYEKEREQWREKCAYKRRTLSGL